MEARQDNGASISPREHRKHSLEKNRSWRRRNGDAFADPSSKAVKASQLFEALRAENPDIGEDELLQGPGYHEPQRKYLQEREEQLMLARIERRTGQGPSYTRSTDAEGGRWNEQQRDRRSAEHSSEDRRSGVRTSVDRRSASFDRRNGSFDRRSVSIDRRSVSIDRRSVSIDRRSASFDRGSANRAPGSTDYLRTHIAYDKSSQEAQQNAVHPSLSPALAASADTHKATQPPHTAQRPSLDQSKGPPARPPSAARRSGDTGAAVATGALGMAAPPSSLANGPNPKSVLIAPAIRALRPGKRSTYERLVSPNALSSLTEDDLFAATSMLAAVQTVAAAPQRGARDNGPHSGSALDNNNAAATGAATAAAVEAGPAGTAAAVQESGLRWTGHTGAKQPDTQLEPCANDAVSPAQAPVSQRARVTASGPDLGVMEVQPLSDSMALEERQTPQQPVTVVGGAAGTGGDKQEAGGRGTDGVSGGRKRVSGDGGGGDGNGGEGADVGDSASRPKSAGSVGTYDEFGDLAQYSRIRQLSIRMCSNPDFEMAVTGVIFANCVTLCLFNPRLPEDSGHNRKLFWAELAFNICFSVEMLLRVISMGSITAYIRRSWNQFDCFMVIAGYTVFVPGNSSAVNAIRALRALRPLRTITRFESLRGVIVCFLEAVPLLASVGGLLLFFVFLYAVAAVQLFQNTYHWTCVDAQGLPYADGEDPGMFGCGGTGHCPTGYTCKYLNKQYTVNVAGFDNTGQAMLSVWQALTLTGWVFMMYRTVDTYSWLAVIYYVTLVFIGAYFVLNLFLAVLKIKFAKAQTLFHNQLELRRGRTRRNTLMTFMSKVQSKFTEFSSKRSQASLLNSKLSSAISSRMSSAPSLPSPRMSGAGVQLDAPMPLDGAIGDDVIALSAGPDKPGIGPDTDDTGGSGGVTRGEGQQGAEAADRDLGVGRKASGTLQRGGSSIGLAQRHTSTSGVEPVRFPSGALSSRGQDSARAGSSGRLSRGGSVEEPMSCRSPLLTQTPSRSALANAKPATPVKSARSSRAVSFRRSLLLLPGGKTDFSDPRRITGSDSYSSRQHGRRITDGSSSAIGEARERRSEETQRLQAWGPASTRTVDVQSGSSNTMTRITITGTGSATVGKTSLRGPKPAVSTHAGDVARIQRQGDTIEPDCLQLWNVNGIPAAPAANTSALEGLLSKATPSRSLSVGCQRQSNGSVPCSGLGSVEDEAVPGLVSALPSALVRAMEGTDWRRRPSGSVLSAPGPVAEAVRFVRENDPHDRSGGGANEGTTQAAAQSGGAPAAEVSASEAAAKSNVHMSLDPTAAAGPGARPASARGSDADRSLTWDRTTSVGPGVNDRTYSAVPSSIGGTNVAMLVMTPAEFDEFVSEHPYVQRQLLRLQYRMRLVVNHNIFNQVFMLLIFINTVLLALEYDKQPHSMTRFLTICNYVLTAIFATEMVVKLFGLGFWDYIRDGFNIFDAIVVTISFIEIVLSSVAGLNAIRALRVLKALRVLRLFKLFRYMQSLRRIGEVLLSAFTSFAAIATLLMLFWMVFSIIGMHVFGSKDLDTYPWPNFSTFLNSLVATWNVLNLENWDSIMHATIRASNYGSSIFFVLWIIIGRYIFLTLFLAVTLEAFEAKYDPNAVRMGAKSGLTSILGSFMSSASSFRSSLSRGTASLASSLRSSRSSKNSMGGSTLGDRSRRSKAGAEDPVERVTPVVGVRPVSPGDKNPPLQLRPGIGYLEDAQAAAAAQYGDGEPRVNIKKMYTIKQWIDTGNMGVLNSDPPEPGPGYWSSDGPPPRPRPPSVDRSSAPTVTARPEPRVQRSGPISAEESSTRPARAGSYIDDSAAQSRASSDAPPICNAGGGGAGGGTNDAAVLTERGPIAEGLEAVPPMTPDATLISAFPSSPRQQQDPSSHPQLPSPSGRPPGRPVRTRSTHLSAAATTVGGWSNSGRRLSSGPMLHSLSLAVRRDLTGTTSFGSGGGANDESEVDDIISSCPSGSLVAAAAAAAAAAAPVTPSRPNSAARVLQPPFILAADGSGLILSRMRGPSRFMMRSNTTTEARTASSLGRSTTVRADSVGEGKPAEDGEAEREEGQSASAIPPSLPTQASAGLENVPSSSMTTTRFGRGADGPSRHVEDRADAAAAAEADPGRSLLSPFATPAPGGDGDGDGVVAFSRPPENEVIMATFQDMLMVRQTVPSSHVSSCEVRRGRSGDVESQQRLQRIRSQLSGWEPLAEAPAVWSASVPARDASGAQDGRTGGSTRVLRGYNSVESAPHPELTRAQFPNGQAQVEGEGPEGPWDPAGRGIGGGVPRSRLDFPHASALPGLAGGDDGLIARLAEGLERALLRDQQSMEASSLLTALTAVSDVNGDGDGRTKTAVQPQSQQAAGGGSDVFTDGPLTNTPAGPGRRSLSRPDVPARPLATVTAAGHPRQRSPDGTGRSGTVHILQDSAHSLNEVGASGARQHAAGGVPGSAGPMAVGGDPRSSSTGSLLSCKTIGCEYPDVAPMGPAGGHAALDTAAGGAVRSGVSVSLQAAGRGGVAAVVDDEQEDFSIVLQAGSTRERIGGGGEKTGGAFAADAGVDCRAASVGRDQWALTAYAGGKTGVAGVSDSGVVDGVVDAGRRGDKVPRMTRISEADSVALSDAGSRAGSIDSRTSGADRSAVSSGDEGTSCDDHKSHKKHYHRRRRNSILIEGTGKSFWIWDEDHPVREKAYWAITHKRFEYAMFALILLNCVALALESPHVPVGSTLDRVLYWSNIGFTILFTIEAVVKIFAFTFVAYIKRITNQVDFLIVVSSLLEIVLMTVTSSIDAVAALRALRAIKPLRLLTRSAGMRLVFKSVTMSLMSMANVSVVCILFFLIFAILGVQLFSGRFYSCNDDSVAGEAECKDSFFDAATNTTIERVWTNAFPNFDNTGSALLCCFITATLNGYTEIMMNAMSAPSEPGYQPRPFQNPGAFFWFFGFIVVCAFTLLNLYVGVIFSQFSKIRMLSETGSAFLTSNQNEWAELTKMVFRLKPPDKAQLPNGRIRRFFHVTVHAKWFDMFIMVVILINVVFMAVTWHHEPEGYTHKKELANYAFLAIFGAEAASKIIALGWVSYLKVGWNKLDFLLLVLGVLDAILSMLQTSFLRILRIFRIQKLITLVRVSHFAQLVKSVKGIQSLFSTLVYSLPAFGNVGALIGLFFFMYAYVGMFLFAKVQHGRYLNSHANFHNFFQSVLVLMRVATGDNWTGIMFDCMVQPPKCTKSDGACGTYLSIPYFLTFVLLISVILLNLFTAVIIETFEKTHEQEEWKLSPQALEDFVTLWSEYDDGSGTILPRHLEELLLRLDPPLGLGPYADNKDVLKFVYDLDIPLVDGRVPFHKTAFELVKRCSEATMPEGAIKEQIDRLVDKFFHELATQDEMLNFSVAITVMKVQRKWRTRVRAFKLLRKKQWRQERRCDAPTYLEVFSAKNVISEKFEAYREAQREGAKAWEVKQQAYNKKPDKAEVARRSEPRWRFNPKYAPVSLVQATSEKTGLLALSKRTINVNRIVGLLRGGLLGVGNTVSGEVAASGAWQSTRSPQGTLNEDPPPTGNWTSPNVAVDVTPVSPLPRLLRAFTSGQIALPGQYNTGGLTNLPANDVGGNSGGNRHPVSRGGGGVGAGNVGAVGLGGRAFSMNGGEVGGDISRAPRRFAGAASAASRRPLVPSSDGTGGSIQTGM